MFAKYFTFRNLYILGFCALFFSLSVSVFVISLSQVFLGLIWLLERNYKEKLSKVSKNKYFWLITSIFFLHIIGLAYTSDFEYALNDLRIKLPILLIPFFITSLAPLSKKEIKILLYFFVAGLITSTAFSYQDYISNIGIQGFDFRYASHFISHVRLSLMIAFAMIFLLFELGNNVNQIVHRIIAGLLFVAFGYYLYALQMMTGIIVFGVAIFILFELKYLRHSKAIFRWIAIILPIASLILVTAYSYSIVYTFIFPKNISLNESITKTNSGNKYHFHGDNLQLENGNLVWDYLSEKEIKVEWKKRSSIGYYKMGHTGQPVRVSLIRYLTSKNVHKDSEGVLGLSDKEINAIENGVTNYLYIDEKGLSKRIYETAWELHNYLVNNDNPSGNSVAQRLEFLRAARFVIGNNWFFGVGTGDIRVELDKAYNNINSVLDEEFRHKPHNQYVTLFICFGFLGLVWFLYVLLSCIEPIKENYLAVAFMIIISLSMITEDTIETQVGVTLFVGFLSLFVLGEANNKTEIN